MGDGESPLTIVLAPLPYEDRSDLVDGRGGYIVGANIQIFVLIEHNAVDGHLLAIVARHVEDFPQCSVRLSVRVVCSYP